jgi:hypothetical protein
MSIRFGKRCKLEFDGDNYEDMAEMMKCAIQASPEFDIVIDFSELGKGELMEAWPYVLDSLDVYAKFLEPGRHTLKVVGRRSQFELGPGVNEADMLTFLNDKGVHCPVSCDFC